jgi:hypothetical protein
VLQVLLVLWGVSSAIANPIFAFAIGVTSCLPLLWLLVGINPYLVVQVKDLLEVGVFNVLSFVISFCIIGTFFFFLPKTSFFAKLLWTLEFFILVDHNVGGLCFHPLWLAIKT